jgi:pyruvate formate lyase activating enzyme
MVLRFLKAAEKHQVPIWIRHVVVPGFTEQELPKVIEIATGFKNLQRIELLPFRKLCKSKYENLGIPFPLETTPECDAALLEKLKEQIPEQFR